MWEQGEGGRRENFQKVHWDLDSRNLNINNELGENIYMFLFNYNKKQPDRYLYRKLFFKKLN